MANSRDGCLRKSMYFNKSAEINANMTPMPADAKNISQKVRSGEKMASTIVIWVAFDGPVADFVMAVVKTIDMASFKILSPNTSILRTGSTSRA